MVSQMPGIDAREGFYIDHGYATIYTGTWQEGAPERSIMSGFKQRPKAQSRVRAEACDRCGFLENYVARKVGAPEAGADLWPVARATLLASIIVLSIAIAILILNIAGASEVPIVLPILLLVLGIILMTTGLASRAKSPE